LYLNFESIAKTLIVLSSIPFSLIGGIVAVDYLGYNLSVAVWVGFIALAGVASEIGVIMITYLDFADAKRISTGSDNVLQAVAEGAGKRVRPIMMTVCAIIGGLMPIMWSHGTGADVMKRIAAPMIGGMVTATIMTLLVIPCIYSMWKESQEKKIERSHTG
jgi:Cu(I)/Ag(I) efflux system membrane protein CusA/SilA